MSKSVHSFTAVRVMLTDLNEVDHDMKVSDSQVPCHQLFTLSLEGQHGLHVLKV